MNVTRVFAARTPETAWHDADMHSIVCLPCQHPQRRKNTKRQNVARAEWRIVANSEAKLRNSLPQERQKLATARLIRPITSRQITGVIKAELLYFETMLAIDQSGAMFNYRTFFELRKRYVTKFRGSSLHSIEHNMTLFQIAVVIEVWRLLKSYNYLPCNLSLFLGLISRVVFSNGMIHYWKQYDHYKKNKKLHSIQGNIIASSIKLHHSTLHLQI